MARRLLTYILLLSFLAVSHLSMAQDKLAQARVHIENKEYDKAVDLYQQLYKSQPGNDEIYSEYLNALLGNKDYKKAGKLWEDRQEIRHNDPRAFVDLGRIYLEQGKTHKAEEQFNLAVQQVNGDDIRTQQIANAFLALGREDYALKTYEQARDLLHNPYLYSGPLSRLYAKSGEIDKAIFTLLEAGPGQMGGLEDTKATMMEFLGTDRKKLQQAQKALVKKINEQPENPYYAELLTWLYTQKDDWDGAFIQMRALDERNKEHGERLLEFARLAVKEKKYDYAIKGYDAIMEKGKDMPYHHIAASEKLGVAFQQLEENFKRTKEDVVKLQKGYEEFMAANPNMYPPNTARDYATLEALYANNPQKGIDILQRLIDNPSTRRDIAGQAKLQLGDYQVLLGKVWDASLTYSQVDKSFREDMLGEEARFRNAKLSYYRGDFEWAQGQLSVLKASTSELIANDALYLSVLITENIPPDSNLVPLRRFAYADLLLFQNKDAEAEALLDSITHAFPEHPLKDDIFMQRARIAEKHQQYDKALSYLKEVHDKYGDDVLGDDALFKAAEINEKYLSKKEEAKKLYEDLIIEYPGSTYVQTARVRLNDLQSSTPIVP